MDSVPCPRRSQACAGWRIRRLAAALLLQSKPKRTVLSFRTAACCLGYPQDTCRCCTHGPALCSMGIQNPFPIQLCLGLSKFSCASRRKADFVCHAKISVHLDVCDLEAQSATTEGHMANLNAGLQRIPHGDPTRAEVHSVYQSQISA